MPDISRPPKERPSRRLTAEEELELFARSDALHAKAVAKLAKKRRDKRTVPTAPFIITAAELANKRAAPPSAKDEGSPREVLRAQAEALFKPRSKS